MRTIQMVTTWWTAVQVTTKRKVAVLVPPSVVV
jgi:hypothetical protein